MPSLKQFQSLKHLHSFFFAPKQAFTLVELIVVISVLGVLATIAFTQVSNVTQSARNSTRMTNIQSISSSLNIYKATNGTYPIPDNKTDILYSGTTIGYQGYIKDTAARLLKLSPTASQDPLNTSTYFSYATNQARTNAQLLSFLEANTTSFKVLPATLASDELATKTPYSKGEELGILYTSGTTTPLTGTSIELNTLTNPYTAYYNSTDSLSGTGNLLQNLVISYAHGSGFGSPSTDDCPTGFIPVPGNKDFNQPGFCVMKYEAKALNGAAGTLGGHLYTLSDNIISSPTEYPINYITQSKAIKACQSIGAHLITNNEWMTIAKNIEQVSLNWSTNQVGSGYIYSGHNDNSPAISLVASADDTQGYINTGNSTGNQKRTLSLTNEQIIWDLAGNMWEHVNKANSIDGFGYATNQMSIASCFAPAGWSEWTSCSDKTFSASNVAWNSSQGVGQIYSSQGVANNVLLRGASWTDSIRGGIFGMRLDCIDGNSSGGGLGFRCAK